MHVHHHYNYDNPYIRKNTFTKFASINYFLDLQKQHIKHAF
ncbi:hypothetical protein DCAR_0414425 [Daucus carota subsp. sativus]|uniref:Uncharacterized protein n=1 Tax=Daucus carota subsp. sativus TaxID=79200 RepID=A0AAF0WUZ2_DAUCS|nr:hypothetical protein DCAR_0414425 [Daucus carota subsp. sativus]